jgi:hypothetical protein
MSVTPEGHYRKGVGDVQVSAPTMSAAMPKSNELAGEAAVSNRLLIIFCFFAI